MLIIGVTGGIACGKTTVAREFEKLGARVIDADAISRELTGESGPALRRIRESFGDGVFARNGALDRAALAQIVFSDERERRALEGILHPMINQEIERQLAECRKSGVSLVVLDVPLLFESGLDALCDFTVCVTAPYETRFERLLSRDNMPREHAVMRIHSAMPLSRIEAMSDAVLENADTPEGLAARVKALLNEAESRCGKGRV